MHNLTPEKELEILEALRVKVAGCAEAQNVVADEPLLDSKYDVLETICIQNSDDETEVKYIKIDFDKFEDSKTDGCEDNPVVYATYKLHVFQQFKDKRGDDSNSTNDIKRLVLNLRNLFLVTDNHARLLSANCEHRPLVLDKSIILGNDELTGFYGHYVDLTCVVEIE